MPDPTMTPKGDAMIHATTAPRRGRPRKPPEPASRPLEAFRSAIRADGRTYPEIAEAAGVGGRTVARLMSEPHEPAWTTAEKILRAIGRKWADLDPA